MKDFFRPSIEPARTLYDAFQKEAEKRKERDSEEWILLERLAVWRAARDYAQQHGLGIPLMHVIEEAEQLACGHVDFGAKWAYKISEYMKKGNI